MIWKQTDMPKKHKIDVVNLFKKRTAEFNTLTNKILDDLSPVIEAAYSVIGEEASEKIEWNEVEFDEHEGLIFIIGFVGINPGEEVTLEDGSDVVVNERNQGQYKRIVRLGIPVDLAQTGDIEMISEFFQKISELEEDEEFENNIPSPTKSPDTVELNNRVDWDINRLSDKQFESLVLWEHINATDKTGKH